MSKPSKKRDESAEADSNTTVTPTDPRAGILIDSGSGPVHELDMSDGERAAHGLAPHATDSPPPNPAVPDSPPDDTRS